MGSPQRTRRSWPGPRRSRLLTRAGTAAARSETRPGTPGSARTGAGWLTRTARREQRPREVPVRRWRAAEIADIRARAHAMWLEFQNYVE